MKEEKMAKICLVMILKNEGKTVHDAIDSVGSIIDEAVICIDNSTTDNTKAECERALSKISVPSIVRSFKWQDDFAKARNDALDEIQYSQYAFILDGHEIVSPQSVIHLNQLKKELSNNQIDVVDVTVSIPTTMGESWFQQPRIFKKHIRYEFSVHNTITHNDNRVAVPQVHLHHNQPRDVAKRRKDQRKRMNIDGLIEKAENGDHRSQFYLANTYKEMEQYIEAIEWYKIYISASEFNSERYQAKLHLADIYKTIDKDDSRLKELLLSCLDDNVDRNEHLIGLGDIYMDAGNYAQAERWYKFATTISMPMHFLNIEREFYTWIPWYKVATAYLGMNNLEGVRKAIKQIKAHDPKISIAYQLKQLVDKKVEEANLVAVKKHCKLYVVASSDSFIKDLLPELDNDFYLRYENTFNVENAKLADIVFCEWADHNAIAATHADIDAKIIVRLHSYEAYVPQFYNEINWNRVHKVIFVNDAIRKILVHNSKTAGTFNYSIIPNMVDYTKFKISAKMKNTVAWAGMIRPVKGLDLLIDIAKALPDYTFHIAGKVSDDAVDLWRYIIRNKPDNVFIYGWQVDLNSFFSDKEFVISMSYRESQHITVLEGMLTGCKPLVRNWPGACNVYKDNWVWEDLETLKILIKKLKGTPLSYRKYVLEKFSSLSTSYQVIDLIKGAYNEVTI